MNMEEEVVILANEIWSELVAWRRTLSVYDESIKR
jgi:hypothetical protein